MAEDTIRLPRSSYEELVKVIRAYGQVPDGAGLNDIAHRSGLNRTTISANNGFLAFLGVIEGGKTKMPTSEGSHLAAALDHEIAEEQERAWRQLVESNDFLMKMVSAVRIRRGMEASSLASHIAYSAGAKKSSTVQTGARAVVDILRASGLVVEKDDRILPGAPTQALSSDDASLRKQGPIASEDGVAVVNPEAATTDHGTGEHIPDIGTSVPGTPKKTTSVNIEIRIDAKPSEVEGLGKKLRYMLRELEGLEVGEGEDISADQNENKDN